MRRMFRTTRIHHLYPYPLIIRSDPRPVKTYAIDVVMYAIFLRKILVCLPGMARMVIIHGSSDSERRLLDKLPNEVRNMDDMHKVKEDFKHKHENASG